MIFWPFLARAAKILCGLTPHGRVYESSELLASAVAVVEEVIVSDRGGSHWSSGISFSQGRISDQVATDNDAIDIHEFIGPLGVAFFLNSRHRATRRLGRVRPDPRLVSRNLLDSVWRKNEPRAQFFFPKRKLERFRLPRRRRGGGARAPNSIGGRGFKWREPRRSHGRRPFMPQTALLRWSRAVGPQSMSRHRRERARERATRSKICVR